MTPSEAAAWKRLRRLLPVAAPARGWLWQLQRIEGAQLGGALASQISLAEAMTVLPAALARTGNNPTTWNLPAYNWQFGITDLASGAAGAWLDAWGRVYAVGRWDAESDSRYARRILSTTIRPTTTNLGMAQALDEGLAAGGTVVQDSQDSLNGPRFNDGVSRANACRLFRVPEYPLGYYWSTFRVFLPGGVPASTAIVRQIGTWKAAGTRMLEIITSDAADWGYGNLYGSSHGRGSD